MLEVHPPHHTVHTWKDFLIHIVAIVIGLLIAVALEQSVEYIHHRRELTQARHELAEEKTKNIAIYHRNRENFATGRKKIELYLAQLRTSMKNPKVPLPVFQMPVGYRYQIYTAWTTAQRSGALTLMPTAEQDDNDRMYVSMHTLDEREDVVYSQIEHVRAVFLADPDPVDVTRDQMVAMYRDLSEALADVDNLADVERITESFSPDFK
jgi:hypothetical protein